jgi:hypothetical protein
MSQGEGDEKRRIGNEIKVFLAVNGIDRGQFAQAAGLGKSTVDKLVTGVFSDKTLAKVMEKTNFKLRTAYAAKVLGGYSKLNWSGYIRKYLMLHPVTDAGGAIKAAVVSIEWNDVLPGLTLRQHLAQKEHAPLGALWIPHERSPLIYIQPLESIGVRLVVSTMVGEACMRGLALTVDNVLAHAYIPVAIPVVLKRLDVNQEIAADALGDIDPSHSQYAAYSEELQVVTEKQFGRLIGWEPENSRTKKRLRS